eukprot:3218481-Amphidinium_carterae.1
MSQRRDTSRNQSYPSLEGFGGEFEFGSSSSGSDHNGYRSLVFSEARFVEAALQNPAAWKAYSMQRIDLRQTLESSVKGLPAMMLVSIWFRVGIAVQLLTRLCFIHDETEFLNLQRSIHSPCCSQNYVWSSCITRVVCVRLDDCPI